MDDGIGWKVHQIGLISAGDCFKRTWAVSKEFLFLPKQSRLFGLDLDRACVDSYKKIIAEVYDG